MPQFLRSLLKLDSHPLKSKPSQSPNSGVHETTSQIPVAQLEVACGRRHDRPQPPQSVIVRRSVSQPFSVSPSQSPMPAGHVESQSPPEHTPAPPVAGGGHTVPHAPQLNASFESSVSQPLSARPSQSPKPPMHSATRHAPAMQTTVALGRLQRTPHPPQFARSRSVEMQRSPHSTGAGATHIAMHDGGPSIDVRAHAGVSPVHVSVHEPHVVAESRSDSQPVSTTPSQSSVPSLHESMTQVPVGQLATPSEIPHGRPHAPQLDAVVSDVSQPLPATPSQLPHDSSQLATPHEPKLHEGTACETAHALVQEPQWFGSSAVVHVVPHNTGASTGHVATQIRAPVESRPQSGKDGFVHARMHSPQCAAVVTSVSHPFAAIPSQLPQPG